MNALTGKHVVIVPAWWPSPEQPHAGVFFHDYVEAFADAGATVGVIYPDLVGFRQLGRGERKPLMPRIIHEKATAGAPVIRIRGLQTSFGSVARRAERYRDWLAKGLVVYRQAHGEPDILHAMCAVPSGWACTHLADPLAKRVILTEHTGPFSLVMDDPESARLAHEALNAAALRVAVSHHLRSQIWDSGVRGVIEVVGNPVPDMFTTSDRLTPARTRPRALYVGRIVPEKGIGELLQAIDLIRKRNVAADFRVLGDGKSALAASLRLYDWGSDGALTCITACERAGVVTHMQDADFLVHPSWGETFGMTVAEALCSGLPVVTTRGTACADFIDDDNGILVAPQDAESLALGMLRMIETCRDYDRTAIAAKAREKFSGAAVAANYLDMIKRILDSD